MKRTSIPFARVLTMLVMVFGLAAATAVSAGAQDAQAVQTYVNVNSYSCPADYDQISDCQKIGDVVVSVLANDVEVGPVTTVAAEGAPVDVPVGTTIEIAVTGGAPVNTTLQEMVSSFTAVEGGNAVTLVFVPIVDAQAGTISLLKLYTVADEESVEFDVSAEEPVVGDGFSPGATSFTLTDAQGNEETVETPDTGEISFPVQTGEYTLTEDGTSASVDFTVGAGETVYVTAVNSYVPEEPADQVGTLQVLKYYCDDVDETTIEVNAPGTGYNTNVPEGCEAGDAEFVVTAYSEDDLDPFTLGEDGDASIELPTTHSVPHILTETCSGVSAPFTIDLNATSTVVVTNPADADCGEVEETPTPTTAKALPNTGSGATAGSNSGPMALFGVLGLIGLVGFVVATRMRSIA